MENIYRRKTGFVKAGAIIARDNLGTSISIPGHAREVGNLETLILLAIKTNPQFRENDGEIHIEVP